MKAPSVAQAGGTLILLLAACNAYDASLLDGALGGGAQAGAGGAPANPGRNGGSSASSGMGPTGGGGNASGGGATTGAGGTGGGKASNGSGGSEDVEAGAAGRSDTGDRGGGSNTGGDVSTGGTSRGGSNNTGGEPTTGGASSGGRETSGGSAGATNGGTANGGTANGGTANGGTTGTAGSAGAKSTGGASGSGGAAGGSAGGSGGAGEVCSGCARLSVPLTVSTDRARFPISLPSKGDFTDATVTVRVARPKGTGGTVLLYLQEGGPDYGIYFSAPIKISSLGASMQNVVWNMADTSAGTSATAIERIGIEVVGTGGSPYTNPTVLYVDRVDVTGSSLTTGSWTFDASSSVHTTPTSSGPVNKIWLNSYSADTTVSGATISWLGP